MGTWGFLAGKVFIADGLFCKASGINGLAGVGDALYFGYSLSSERVDLEVVWRLGAMEDLLQVAMLGRVTSAQ